MITVLRLGHRPSRDKRITTHVALVARAFGADRIVIPTKDEKLAETVMGVCDRFGSDFSIETGTPWRGVLRGWKGTSVHLTMYGEPLDEVIRKLAGLEKNRQAGQENSKVQQTDEDDLLVVLGSEKVPREVYESVTYNVAVGNQPHSEVAALAMFLDRYFRGEQFARNFGGRMEVVPSARGKCVESRE